MNGRVIPVFLGLLTWHMAHVLEEVWGRFWPMDQLYGEGLFLILNWVLYVIPMTLFYFVLLRRRWAFLLGMIYAGIMILNGSGHLLATFVTGRYFGGFAGGYTGIGLVVIGVPLLYYLWKEMPGASVARIAS